MTAWLKHINLLWNHARHYTFFKSPTPSILILALGIFRLLIDNLAFFEGIGMLHVINQRERGIFRFWMRGRHPTDQLQTVGSVKYIYMSTLNYFFFIVNLIFYINFILHLNFRLWTGSNIASRNPDRSIMGNHNHWQSG